MRSYPELARRYAAFRDSVFGGVREDPPLPGLEALPDEMELQSRWFAGEFGDRFTTTDGRPVQLRSFGHWNHAAGPDFTETSIELDGEVLTGSIELDTDVRDWEHHRHSTNTDYENVVLHLHFAGPAREAVFTRTPTHRQIPQVRLELSMLEGGAPPPRDLAEARLGHCSTPLAEMEPERVNLLLEAAAQHRLEAKHERLARTIRHHGRDQALFEAVAQAFGYRHNQLPMRVLAQRLPLHELKKDPATREPLLLGLAGFLEADGFESAPTDTRSYLRELWESWWKTRDLHAGKTLPQWRLAGLRPGNHPQRRIGALAVLVAEWKRFAALLEHGATFEDREFVGFLTGLEHDYWSHHYTLASAPAAKPIRLVGETRAIELLANLVYPLLVPDHSSLWANYLQLRAKLDNQKVRRAAIRLFGQRPDAAQFQKFVHQQQALLQIFDDFCLADDSGCEDCPFPERLAQWQ